MIKKVIAKGYHGIQNKGHGWILSAIKIEKLDVNFFAEKIKSAIKYREVIF